MDLNIHIDIFFDIDRHRDEIQHLNSYDPVTKIIKDKFQLENYTTFSIIKSRTRTDTKYEILKSATSKEQRLKMQQKYKRRFISTLDENMLAHCLCLIWLSVMF